MEIVECRGVYPTLMCRPVYELKHKVLCVSAFVSYNFMMMQQRQIIVDGILTSYRLAGSGRVVLCLHGWGDSSGTFQTLIDSLSSDYCIIAVDLPGFGRTGKPPRPWSLDEYGRFVAKFLQKIRITELYGVIGHSNGAAITLRALAKKYLIADKAVLLAAAGIRSDDKTKKRLLRLAAKTSKIMVSPLPRSLKTQLKRKAYGAIGSDLFVAEDMQDTFKNIINDDVSNDAASITVDTLLIYGALDTATPPRYGEKLKHAIKHSQLHVLPDCGHFVHHDSAATVQSLIKDFMK